MKKTFLNPLIAAWLAFIALTALPALRAQTETKPAEPAVAPTQAVESEKKPMQVVVPAAPEASMSVTVETEDVGEETKSVDEKSTELRELGTEEPAPVVVKKPVVSSKKKKSTRNYDARQDGPPIGNHHVAKGAKRSEAVSVMGSTTVDGEVTNEAVSVMGNTTVNGSVLGEVVTVMGNTTINGKAHDIVTVMGDVILGPEAVVTGDVTIVMGTVKKAEGAQLLGDVHEVTNFGNFGGNGGFEGLHAWFAKCLLYGRPLWIGENLGWIWVVAAAFLVFYMVLALISPRGVVRCAEVLEQKPGATILAAFLTIIITPVAFVLLAITGIGLIFIPFIIIALMFGSLFGMAAVLAWFGRRVVGSNAAGILSQPFFNVLIGGVLVSVLYMIPFVGIILWKLFGILGLGMVVYALIQASKRDKPVATPKPAATVPPAYAQQTQSFQPMSAGFTGATSVPVDAVPVAEQVPPFQQTTFATPPLQSAFVPPPVLPVISAATLPRVGFWLRLGAATIDAVLIGMLCGLMSGVFHDFGSGYLFWYALYCVIMWALKGTTVGGVVCGLKVVRLDDRPIDWGVATVRALGGFLSLFVAGLGFIWVAFDDDKQAWHDKIAGTTIVRVPKGTPLI